MQTYEAISVFYLFKALIRGIAFTNRIFFLLKKTSILTYIRWLLRNKCKRIQQSLFFFICLRHLTFSELPSNISALSIDIITAVRSLYCSVQHKEYRRCRHIFADPNKDTDPDPDPSYRAYMVKISHGIYSYWVTFIVLWCTRQWYLH